MFLKKGNDLVILGLGKFRNLMRCSGYEVPGDLMAKLLTILEPERIGP